jgi:hypothetical protein
MDYDNARRSKMGRQRGVPLMIRCRIRRRDENGRFVTSIAFLNLNAHGEQDEGKFAKNSDEGFSSPKAVPLIRLLAISRVSGNLTHTN